ncbi:unnamed protein product [Amaranthus hypochondriacus]
MKVGVLFIMVVLGCSLKACEATIDDSEFFHVSGFVKCQDCSETYSQWVQGAKPIQGSRVSITCLDDNKRTAHYGSDETDKEGQFNMAVNKTSHSNKKLNPKDCIVRLVSCPDTSCNIPTDFGLGITGVKLRQPSVVYRGTTQYVVGPFYYTTPACNDDQHSDGDDTSTYQGSY